MSEIESELLAGASLASPNAARRRFVRNRSGNPAELPGEQIDLLLRWIKPRQLRRKWDTLLADAGGARLEIAIKLANWLLRHGWTVQHEKRQGSRWQTIWLEFPQLDALRETFRLPDPDRLAAEWAATIDFRFDDGELAAAHAALASLPLARRLKRLELLQQLARWHDEAHTGTRRDFALFARGDSKAVTAAEWRWLESVTCLPTRGIAAHTPLLLIAGPLRLLTTKGMIDLAASKEWMALTPETVASVLRSDGLPRVWRLVENLTSFERQARARAADEAVVWLPGYPPSWWLQAMRHLLCGAPGAAEIACDPDPDGIAIALQAAAVWEALRLPWQTVAMDRDDLLDMRTRKPLTARDRERLASLLAEKLPPSLRELATTMQTIGEKGEQELYL